MDCHSLLQGIFPTQGSNQGVLHCRQILYHLRYKVLWELKRIQWSDVGKSPVTGTQWAFSKCKLLYLFILLISFGYLCLSSLTCPGLALLEVSSGWLANACWSNKWVLGKADQMVGWLWVGNGPQLGVDRGWAWSLNQDLSQGSELESNRKVTVILLSKKVRDPNSTLLGYMTWRRIHLLVKAGHPSPTRWTCVWANSRSWWWSGKPGVLQPMGLQRVRYDLVTEQQQRHP